jgi:two-component system, NtrC family, response regulator AtoC
MTKRRVLIVDDEESVRHMLSILLKKEGYDVDTAASANSAIDKIQKDQYDFVLSDIRMPQMDGLTFLKQIKKSNPHIVVLIMSAYGNVDTAIEAMKLGAYDYIAKPFKPDEILLTLKKAEERQRLEQENILLKGEMKKEYSFANIIAKSPKMMAIFDTIKKVADYKTTTLLIGESGTGKELVARALHYNSARADKPFITVNCGAIPENLLESELFGHVKGSFTGAHRTKTGLFEDADHGTLFLDEIGELPLLLQVKLLRALQEEEIRRVGDNTPIKVDVRIIAATVRDLTKEVEQGNFREDLFYRLNVLPLYIPPLRERKEDVPILVNYFIDKYNKKLNMQIKGVTNDALNILLESDWQGNVRELENTIERAMVLANSSKIGVENLPTSLRGGGGFKSRFRVVRDDLSIKKMARILEEDLILKAMDKAKGNKTMAAKLLEISHRALLYKIKEYKLENKLSGKQD